HDNLFGRELSQTLRRRRADDIEFHRPNFLFQLLHHPVDEIERGLLIHIPEHGAQKEDATVLAFFKRNHARYPFNGEREYTHIELSVLEHQRLVVFRPYQELVERSAEGQLQVFDQDKKQKPEEARKGLFFGGIETSIWLDQHVMEI